MGNFATVDGLDRHQIVKLDVGRDPATVANWETKRYKSARAWAFDWYMRDPDIRPERHLLRGRHHRRVLRRRRRRHLYATPRWETAATGTTCSPPGWSTPAGTPWSALTGQAVYVGGHQRWLNNRFAGDGAGRARRPAGSRRGRPAQRFAAELDGEHASRDVKASSSSTPRPAATACGGAATVVASPASVMSCARAAAGRRWHRGAAALGVPPAQRPVELGLQRRLGHALCYSSYNGASFGSNSSLNTPGESTGA